MPCGLCGASPDRYDPDSTEITEATILHGIAVRRSGQARGWVAACCAAAGLAAVVTTAALAAATTNASSAWTLKLATRYFPPASNHSQYDIVLLVRGRAWFLGGSNVAGAGVPEAEYRTDGRWFSAPLPAGTHSWIDAASATSRGDIWAVTYLGGSLLRWDGTRWTTERNGGWKARTQFTGILALSARDVWLFGASGRRHAGAGTWHLSGSRWTRVRGAAADLAQASAASPTDVWGIGGTGGSVTALLHLRGTAWHRVRPAALAGFRYSRIAALSPRNVWVAGTVAGAARLGHYDGRRWTTLRMPGQVAATGMCRDGNGGLWVIANAGRGPSVVLDRSAGGTWTKAKVSSSAADELLACAWLPGTRAAWGAGKAAAPLGTAAAAYGYGR